MASPSPKRQRNSLPDSDLLCDETLTPMMEGDVPSSDSNESSSPKFAGTLTFPPESYISPVVVPARIPVEQWAPGYVAAVEQWTPDSLVPAGAYNLLLQLRGCFVHSPLPTANATDDDDDDDDDTRGYELLVGMERKKELRCNEGYSLHILERNRMVDWMTRYRLQPRGEDREKGLRELQKETLFLAVSIFDRFLSAGYFNPEVEVIKYLKTAGVACLMIARRLEETYPYTYEDDQDFNVLGERYSRLEVVAMEWLVQEVLRFRCYSPTVYDFLRFFLDSKGVDDDLTKAVAGLAQRTLSKDTLLGFWPSTRAAALVILACPDSDLVKILVKKDADLEKCIEATSKELGMAGQ